MVYNSWKNEKKRLRAIEEEEAAEAARAAHHDRWHELWNVPERARDEYIAMEDNFSPSTVLDFMLAMHPEED